jgi:hypothetical protein
MGLAWGGRYSGVATDIAWSGGMVRPSSGPTFEGLHLLGVLGTEGLAMVMAGSFGSSDEYVYYEALLIWTR